MWFWLLIGLLFAQWNDTPNIRKQTLDILKACGFTKVEFEHLKSIYDSHVPELQEKISHNKALRDEKMQKLWDAVKERVRDMEGESINEILNKELQKIKEFLNEISRQNGLPVQGLGRPLQYDLIGQSERRNILISIKKSFPKGPTSAEDFKVMFNVMRAFLVIRGTEHIDERMHGAPLVDGEGEEPEAPDSDDDTDKTPKEPSEMMNDHGLQGNKARVTPSSEMEKDHMSDSEKVDASNIATEPTDSDASSNHPQPPSFLQSGAASVQGSKTNETPGHPAKPLEPAPINSGPAPDSNVKSSATSSTPAIKAPAISTNPTTTTTPRDQQKPPHTRAATEESTLVESITNVFTTIQLRWIIYTFIGFVVLLGFYLLSPSENSEMDYMPLFDDEI